MPASDIPGLRGCAKTTAVSMVARVLLKLHKRRFSS